MERLIELSLNLLIGIGIGFCIVYLRKLIDTLVEMRLVSAGNAFWCLSLGMFVLSLMITIPKHNSLPKNVPRLSEIGGNRPTTVLRSAKASLF